MAKASGYHPEKPMIQAIPDPPLAYGFQSKEEHQWYYRYFHDRKLMVERPLDDTWSDPTTVLFFLTRLRAYPRWIPLWTARKRVNVA